MCVCHIRNQSLTNVSLHSVYLHIYIHNYIQVAHNFDTFYATKLKFGMIFTQTKTLNFMVELLTSVAQLEVHLTGDQEVTGSTPAEVGNILSWRLIVKYFLRSFSPFRWFKKGSCQFLAKECAQYCLTA